MSKNEIKDVLENQQPFDSARPFAKGVSTKKYIELYIKAQKSGYLANNNTIWLPGSRGEMLRQFSPDNLKPPHVSDIKKILNLKRIWIASYLCEPTSSKPANAFLYLCRDPEYDIKNLNKKSRNHIRKGMRHFRIRLCTWQEVIEKGYPADLDTRNRHNYVPHSQEEFAERIKSRQFNDIFEVWGAWDGENLAAWSLVCKIDNWANILTSCSRTVYLRYQPNIALRYCITKRMLVEEKRKMTYSGVSSIFEGKQLGLHRYKLSSGYEPVPARREFVMPTFFMPMIRSRTFSWCVEKVEGVFPFSPKVKKANGLLRLTSGREKNPLAWAQQKNDDDQMNG